MLQRQMCVGVGVVGEGACRMANGAGALFCERSFSGWEGSWRAAPLRFAFDKDVRVPHHLSFVFCMRRGCACVLSPFSRSSGSRLHAATASRSRLAFDVPASPPPLIHVSCLMSLPATFTFRLHVAFGEGMPAITSSHSHVTFDEGVPATSNM